MHQQAGCAWGQGAMAAAVKRHWQLAEVLQLAQAGCPWDKGIMPSAAVSQEGYFEYNGYIPWTVEDVTRLRQAGCPWDQRFMPRIT